MSAVRVIDRRHAVIQLFPGETAEATAEAIAVATAVARVKKVLIVYAHQSPHSFNAAAKDAAVEVLTLQGYTVEVSDLYAMNFKATATAEDINGEVHNPDNFQYANETKLAWEEEKLSADITVEHKKLKEADLVIFQFPMYWFTVPAIMKGWIDRVLTLGFAYTPEKRYSQGIFKDKRAMLSFTTGSLESMFSDHGINGDINVTLWPIQNGILHYCGFQVLAPQIFWAPSHVACDIRDTELVIWRSRLLSLLAEVPLSFTPSDCFDGETGFQLKPEVRRSMQTRSLACLWEPTWENRFHPTTRENSGRVTVL